VALLGDRLWPRTVGIVTRLATTDRDLQLVRWVGEQYAVPMAVLAELVRRDSPVTLAPDSAARSRAGRRPALSSSASPTAAPCWGRCGWPRPGGACGRPASSSGPGTSPSTPGASHTSRPAPGSGSGSSRPTPMAARSRTGPFGPAGTARAPASGWRTAGCGGPRVGRPGSSSSATSSAPTATPRRWPTATRPGLPACGGSPQLRRSTYCVRGSRLRAPAPTMRSRQSPRGWPRDRPRPPRHRAAGPLPRARPDSCWPPWPWSWSPHPHWPVGWPARW
jgi:hypothetical protein